MNLTLKRYDNARSLHWEVVQVRLQAGAEESEDDSKAGHHDAGHVGERLSQGVPSKIGGKIAEMLPEVSSEERLKKVEQAIPKAGFSLASVVSLYTGICTSPLLPSHLCLFELAPYVGRKQDAPLEVMPFLTMPDPHFVRPYSLLTFCERIHFLQRACLHGKASFVISLSQLS